jgi:hypothetical protein
MKKISILILAISITLAAFKAVDKTNPTIELTGLPISLTIKDSTGKVTGGEKYMYTAQKKIFRTITLDTALNKTTLGYLYTYNAEGKITKIEHTFNSANGSFTALCSRTKVFIYTKGLVSRKIYDFASPDDAYSDTTNYGYNSDNTLKYILTSNDSTAYLNYVKGKPTTAELYKRENKKITSSAPFRTYHYTYDNNNDLIKEEVKKENGTVQVTQENTYSNYSSSISTDTSPDPSPEYVFFVPKFLMNSQMYYDASSPKPNTKKYEFVFSNYLTVAGKLMSYNFKSNRFNPNNTLKSSKNSSYTFIYSAK